MIFITLVPSTLSVKAVSRSKVICLITVFLDLGDNFIFLLFSLKDIFVKSLPNTGVDFISLVLSLVTGRVLSPTRLLISIILIKFLFFNLFSL